MNQYFKSTSETAREGQSDMKNTEIKEPQFFQRGLGLKKEVEETLKRDYFSDIVALIRANGYKLTTGAAEFFLAKEFGFCYGVDRAVDYAYQTREKFPDKRVFITGEIIHNPHVNKRLIEMGIRFLSGQYSSGIKISDLKTDDVVILPAFGVSIHEFEALSRQNCILVDTTCGSVLNVWKRVAHYARNGFTSVIHGKYYHEETIATSSQALKYPGGRYLVVRNMDETERVCEYIRNGGDKKAFVDYFEKSMSPGFDPDRDLNKIGVANQTTMLSSESLAIARKIADAIRDRYGDKQHSQHFMTFDTICSATQDRQDAVLELVTGRKLDLMLVIGGYNSSNTNHLAELTSKYTTTYHIDDPECILSRAVIKHKKIGSDDILLTEDWLEQKCPAIGLTAGASTPNNKIGEAIEKVLRLLDVEIPAVLSS
jgi:4-hydroxy-3-methylbut-2-enyl diphosphate reductase